MLFRIACSAVYLETESDIRLGINTSQIPTSSLLVLESHHKKSTKMKISIVAVLALACVLSVATANNFGQGYYPQQQASGGLLSSILPLLLLLLIFPTLFGQTDKGDTTIIYGNFSSTSGK